MGGGEGRRREGWEGRRRGVKGGKSEKREGKGKDMERGQRGGEGENIGKGKLVFWMKAGPFLLSTCTT